MDEPAPEVELIPKANTKSVVWTYFGFEPGSNGKPKNESAAVCRLCKREVQAGGGNTSNLFSHLRSTHPAKYSAIKGGKQQTEQSKPKMSETGTIAQAFARGEKYNRSSRKWQEVTDLVSMCIAKDQMPIYSVEKAGFKALLRALDPRYELPSRKYFSQTAIPKLYAMTRDTVATELKQIKFFSATSDLWSSTTMEPYISFTVHYIDDTWALRSRCLQTLFIPEDHPAENIAESLQSTLESWGLSDHQLLGFTSDNGRNIVKAARDMGWQRLSCFGHNLDLAIMSSLKNEARVNRALGVCRKIVTGFSHSWKRKQELAKAQMELNLPTHSLVLVSSC